MDYSINDFSGWISMDDTFLWKWQCVFSQWIDTLRYPWELRLTPAIEYSSRYGTEAVTSIFSPEWSTIWYGTGDWIVRDYAGSSKIDTWDTRDILDGILFRGNFYIFSSRYVYKTTYTSGVLSALTTFFDHTGSLWSYSHPVIYASNEMYFSSWKVVKYIDEFGNLQTLPQTFSTDVKALTISGNTLRIYTENTLAILDVWTKTVSYSQQLPFVTGWATSDGIVDYVTSENDEIYICSGLEWRKIAFYQQSDTINASDETNVKFTFKNNREWRTIACANWRVVTLERVVNRALLYWSKIQWLPNAFQYLPKYDNETTWWVNTFPIGTYRCVFARNNQIYIGYSCNWQERIWRIDFNFSNSYYAFEGIYITPHTDLWDYSIIKSIEEIRVGKEGLNWELWCSIDDGNFQLVGALNQEDIEQKFMNYKKDFREIAFMVKLYSQFDRVYNINLRYNQHQV